MADVWKEIERLQANLQRTQHSSTKQKLSERNCIEILMKLQEMNLLDVMHSSDGKEYLTPKQLTREIKDELYMHGGRVNMVELQQALNVDYSHIEAKCNDLVKSDRKLQIIYGQIIERSYLDRLAEELNDNLQSCGQLTIAEVSKTYDLPGEFLIPELMARLGSIIQGQMDKHRKDSIYTEAYVASHKARIRGLLSAVTRPTTFQTLSSQDLPLQLLFSIVEELIKEGRIRGQVVGGRSEKSTFLPNIHTETQNHWIDNFFAQNNYLEYDAVYRLGITDAKSYLKRRLEPSKTKPLFLKTVCVGWSLIDQVVASIEEALSNGEWTDISVLLPSSFSSEDSNQLLHHIQRERLKQTGSVPGVIFADTIIASQSFVDSCLKHFDGMIKGKADKDAKKASVFALTEEERKEYSGQTTDLSKKADKKDERRKKAFEGSGSIKRSGDGGSGIGGREVKTKGKDKKRMKWKKEQEMQEDKPSRSQQHQQEEASFMDIDEITDVLRDRHNDCPDAFLEELGAKLHRPLTAAYQSAVKSVFLLSAQQMKEKQKALTKKTDEFDSLDRSSYKSRRQLEEEINAMWSKTRLFMEALNFFEGEVSGILQKHLLATVCTDITNSLFMLTANEFLSGVEIDKEINAEVRIKLLSRFPNNVKPSLTRLNNSLVGRIIDEFQTALTDATSRDVCDVMLKSGDKKRDRQVSHSHKMSHLQQLREESNPALVLHIATLVIFQSVTGTMLNAPGKVVPNIINRLQSFLDREVFLNLISYQELVVKHLTLLNNNGDNLEIGEVEQKLNENLDEIKQLAATTKKKQAN
ncbi:E3 UFM1-protein ligase 1-like [Clavelina lepadiformis]|uniref:E3 UFM1-protein ligase 1-like n=1 Tax=Clavelina lepadiformis TaxID=159417 RepID=UPI0040434404